MLNFNIIVETKGSFYGINDCEKNTVFVKRIGTKNQFGISSKLEPSIIGSSWEIGECGQLVVRDENGKIMLDTQKVVKTFREGENGTNGKSD